MAIVVVNAEQLREGRDLEGTFEDQVHSADLLVLNKVDLVAPEELDALETQLRAIEHEAPIVRAVQGRIELGLLFPPDAALPDRSGPAPTHPDHHHEHFATEIWTLPRDTTRAELEAKLGDDDALLRAKGFVELEGTLCLVQLVGRRLEIEPSELAPPAGSVGKLVLISRA